MGLATKVDLTLKVPLTAKASTRSLEESHIIRVTGIMGRDLAMVGLSTHRPASMTETGLMMCKMELA